MICQDDGTEKCKWCSTPLPNKMLRNCSSPDCPKVASINPDQSHPRRGLGTLTAWVISKFVTKKKAGCSPCAARAEAMNNFGDRMLTRLRTLLAAIWYAMTFKWVRRKSKKVKKWKQPKMKPMVHPSVRAQQRIDGALPIQAYKVIGHKPS